MKNSPLRLLIVEDHKGLAENLFEFFSDTGRYTLDFAPDGLTALHLVATHHYDVIILDVMLPGVGGFTICQRLRQELGCWTPVIMMTAKDQLDDKEAGFGAGADDYLVKPFDLKELKLRVEALARRGGARASGELTIDGVRYDPGTLTVSVQGKGSLELSGIAAKMLERLMRSHPDLVSYEELIESVWNGREVDRHTVRTHAYALRKLLQQHFGMTLIKTLHGKGYRLVVPGEAP